MKTIQYKSYIPHKSKLGQGLTDKHYNVHQMPEIQMKQNATT